MTTTGAAVRHFADLLSSKLALSVWSCCFLPSPHLISRRCCLLCHVDLSPVTVMLKVSYDKKKSAFLLLVYLFVLLTTWQLLHFVSKRSQNLWRLFFRLCGWGVYRAYEAIVWELGKAKMSGVHRFLLYQTASAVSAHSKDWRKNAWQSKPEPALLKALLYAPLNYCILHKRHIGFCHIRTLDYVALSWRQNVQVWTCIDLTKASIKKICLLICSMKQRRTDSWRGGHINRMNWSEDEMRQTLDRLLTWPDQESVTEQILDIFKVLNPKYPDSHTTVRAYTPLCLFPTAITPHNYKNTIETAFAAQLLKLYRLTHK